MESSSGICDVIEPRKVTDKQTEQNDAEVGRGVSGKTVGNWINTQLPIYQLTEAEHWLCYHRLYWLDPVLNLQKEIGPRVCDILLIHRRAKVLPSVTLYVLSDTYQYIYV